MNPNKLQQAIPLYDRFTHEGMDRRDFFARMTLIAGSAAAATSLITAIAASPAPGETRVASAGARASTPPPTHRSRREREL